jgi:hypothetical protein
LCHHPGNLIRQQDEHVRNISIARAVAFSVVPIGDPPWLAGWLGHASLAASATVRHGNHANGTEGS